MPPILKYFNPIQKSFSSSFALIEDDLAELSISSQVLTPKTQAIPLSVKPDPLVFDRNCIWFFPFAISVLKSRKLLFVRASVQVQVSY